jgi:hypothetical protein
MMKSLLVAVMVAMSLSSVAQEIKHAPTMESCQADFNLWMAGISRAARGEPSPVANLSFDELFSRIAYIRDCKDANPALKKNCDDEGLLLDWMYGVEMRNRLLRFVKRHDLKETFLEEDKAEKR